MKRLGKKQGLLYAFHSSACNHITPLFKQEGNSVCKPEYIDALHDHNQ
jgi:hypothetical protein